MLNNFIRKVEKINVVVIISFGAAVSLSILNNGVTDSIYLLGLLIVALVILGIMNHLLKLEPIVHRSPIYYYVFLTLSTLAIYLDGAYSSRLFPALFILPILYISVNFSRKGSTGVAFFSIAIIWFTLLQDKELYKLNESIIISIIIIALPHIIGFIVKEYVNNMKKLVKLNRLNQIERK